MSNHAPVDNPAPDANANPIDEYDTLIGLEVADGRNDYGKVVRIRISHSTNETIYYAVTDRNVEIDAGILFELIRIHRDAEKRKTNPNYLGIAYPDGSDYCKRVMGPQRKRRAYVIGSSQQIHPSQLEWEKGKRNA
jgi:hypothetical protein